MKVRMTVRMGNDPIFDHEFSVEEPGDLAKNAAIGFERFRNLYPMISLLEEAVSVKFENA